MLMLLCVLLVLLAGSQLAASQETDASHTLTYPGRILRGNDQACPTSEEREQVRNMIDSDLRSLLPIVLPSSEPCGGAGWRRIAYLNMTDLTQRCPHPWREYGNPGRSCGRSTSNIGSCDSVWYSSHGIRYSKMCGRIIGYQYGDPDAFFASTANPYSNAALHSLNTIFVDGVVVTHGYPRVHVWTFAGGLDETSDNPRRCPCSNPPNSTTIASAPSYVGYNYFCEAGAVTNPASYDAPIYYPRDPLWDGQGCVPTNNCCAFNSPPWFTAQLTIPTADDIEVRICGHDRTVDADTPVELIELYVT